MAAMGIDVVRIFSAIVMSTSTGCRALVMDLLGHGREKLDRFLSRLTHHPIRPHAVNHAQGGKHHPYIIIYFYLINGRFILNE